MAYCEQVMVQCYGKGKPLDLSDRASFIEDPISWES